jgi:hypothetical protein
MTGKTMRSNGDATEKDRGMNRTSDGSPSEPRTEHEIGFEPGSAVSVQEAADRTSPDLHDPK